jgi:hypothetical protein
MVAKEDEVQVDWRISTNGLSHHTECARTLLTIISNTQVHGFLGEIPSLH